MSTTEANSLLRAGLLEGVGIVVAGGPGTAAGGERGSFEASTIGSAIGRDCAALGAGVLACSPLEQDGAAVAEAELEAVVDRALGELGSVELLVVDSADMFGALAALAGSRGALVGCLAATWDITRAVATRAFIGRERAGRIVFVAPPAVTDGSQIGEHGDAAGAALENLARTLSIEWARFGISPVAIAPGASTTGREIAALVAFLGSAAGAYFSGCLLDLRGPAAASSLQLQRLP